MVQTRAKRARIQSQRSLSPESALNPPFPLKEPLEVSVPTTSSFNGVFGLNKNKHLSDNRIHEPIEGEGGFKADSGLRGL